MMVINFPVPQFKIKTEKSRDWIFDSIRKKWVRLTPEEWVRQNFIAYLVVEKQYPASLISVEKGLLLGELTKRCDIVIYKNEQPWMLVECKEPAVSLTEHTLLQTLRYNMVKNCSFLVITNGKITEAWHIENEKAMPVASLPDWVF